MRYAGCQIVILSVSEGSCPEKEQILTLHYVQSEVL